MRSSDIVEWPQSWRSSVEPRYYISLISIIVFFVAAPIAIAFYFWHLERFGDARYFSAFALMCSTAAWTVYHARFRRRRRGSQPLSTNTSEKGAAGLRIPYSKELFIGFALNMAVLAGMFVMSAVDLSQENPDNAAAAIAIFGGIALFFASLPLLMATGRFARGHLIVSPDGIYQRGWTFSSYLPWSDIRAVHPYYADGPQILLLADDDTPWERKQILKFWKADRLPNIPQDHGHGTKPVIIVPGQSLAVDPALVLHLLVFYAKHPEARSELGTDAALRRARTGAFT